LSLNFKRGLFGLSLVLLLDCALQSLECVSVDQFFNRPTAEQDGELVVVSGELVDGKMYNAAVDAGNIGRLLDALLELDVLVPERMTLEVKADEVSTALE
jgi:hypothetical protein